MSGQIITITQRTAEDEGEFASPALAAAWVAGAVLAFQDAETIHTTIRHESRTDVDPHAPGSFIWSRPVWIARVEASWPRGRVAVTSNLRIDMTPVASALIEVERTMEEETK